MPRYGEMLREFKNEYLSLKRVSNLYPSTIAGAFEFMNDWILPVGQEKKEPWYPAESEMVLANVQKGKGDNEDFIQAMQGGLTGKELEEVVCFDCRKGTLCK